MPIKSLHFAPLRLCVNSFRSIAGFRFSEDVDFGEAVFQDGLNFQMTLFVERAVFEGAQFTGEVILSEVHAKHLKKFNASAACLDGAVLESAELWENNRIEGFSLRGAKSAGTFRCDSANARACYSLLHSFSKPSFGTRAMNLPVCSPSRADSVTFRNSYQNENLSARVSSSTAAARCGRVSRR